MSLVSFNDGWTFARAGAASWAPVTLPHDAMRYEPRTPDTPNAQHTGWCPGGRYTYRTDWTAPADLAGRHAALVLEGSYHRTTVTVDGAVAGGCLTGYTEFEVPLADALEAGRTYEVTVEVDNADGPNSRWYSGSGLYRPVWLRTWGPVGFTRDGLRVSLDDDGEVTVAVALTAPTGALVRVRLGDATVSVPVEPGQTEASARLRLDGLRRWSADDPHLYELHAEVVVGGEVSDTWQQRVGLRTVRAVPGEGLLVNGREVLLRGACIHHDNGVLGATTLAAAERRRVRILAEQGFNAVRMSHHPASRALLAACDERGVYVIDELTDVWFRHKTAHDLADRFADTWPLDVDAMVAKDRNHACVLMYSTGNEIAETGVAEGVAAAQAIADRLRTADATRLVTAGINPMLTSLAARGRKGPFDGGGPATKDPKPQGALTSTGYNLFVSRLGRLMELSTLTRSVGRAVEPVAGTLDVLGYNYAVPRYRVDARRHPARVIVGTETMPYDIARNWALVRELPAVVGDFMWTGWDYLGEAGIGVWSHDGDTRFAKPYPYLLAGPGAIDVTGHPGAPMLLARAVWGVADGPEIAVRPVSATGRLAKAPWRGTDAVPGWGWTGCEGQRAEVEVYSAAPTVELLVNGVSVGTRRAGPGHGYRARFVGEWVPGELTAVARDASGHEVARSVARSVRGPVGLVARADRTTLAADGQDAAFVTVELADATGTVELSRDVEVQVEVDGPAELAGLGSADPAPLLPHTGTRTRTWYGRALAVVRTTRDPGEVLVRVSAAGYRDAEVTLTTR